MKLAEFSRKTENNRIYGLDTNNMNIRHLYKDKMDLKNVTNLQLTT